MPTSSTTPTARRRSLLAVVLLLLGIVLLTFVLVRDPPSVMLGQMHIAQGQQERAVVADAHTLPQDLRVPNAVIARVVSGNTIRFQDGATAERWIDPLKQYDVVGLPFLVETRAVEMGEIPQPKYYLQIETPTTTIRRAAPPGSTVDIEGGEPLVVEGIRSWQGLLRDPKGTPMISVSVWSRKESEKVFLVGAEERAYTPSGLGVSFAWTSSEQASRDAVHTPPEAPTARWGVEDGGTISWLDSFTPGTGLRLKNGEDLTLSRVTPRPDGTPESIEVVITRKDASTKTISCDTISHTGLLRLESPQKPAVQVTVASWRDGTAAIAVYAHGAPQGEALLQENEEWATPDASWRIRVNQVLSQAIPIAASSLDEAVLKDKQRVYALREGEKTRINDALVQLTKEAVPLKMTYALAILDAQGRELCALTLGPEAHVAYGEWVFMQGPFDPLHPDTAALLVGIRPFALRGIDVLLVALVALGLLLGGTWLLTTAGRSGLG